MHITLWIPSASKSNALLAQVAGHAAPPLRPHYRHHSPVEAGSLQLAGSTTIDNEFTDDFKDVNGASLARCGSHLEPQPALEPCAPLAHLLTCPSCGTRNPPPLCMFAATGRHYRSWSTAADFLALVRRFSSCRPPRTTPPRAHGPLWPALFYETAGAWFWWWAHEPASWGDVWYCVCLRLCRVAFLDSCMCSG